MLAVAIDLLAGRYVATAYNDRDRVEWPPHPARFFSALVATWAEGDPDGEAGDIERRALIWLEQQAPPQILASSSKDVARRTVLPVFVPVNDVATVAPPDRTKLDSLDVLESPPSAQKNKEAARFREKLLSDTARAIAVPTRFADEVVRHAAGLISVERRSKQPRTFPSLTPAYPTVIFVWPSAHLPEELRAALDGLLTRLVRVGHSSTLVSASTVDAETLKRADEKTALFVPDESGGELVLRWVSPGQFERLQLAFERHRETEARVLPARFVRYAEGQGVSTVPPSCSLFADGDFIVLARIGGPRLPITSVAGVSSQLRKALMSLADKPINELISGHQAQGAASEQPHLAVVPLPFVGAERADGTILGVALVVPKGCDEQHRRSLLKAVHSLEARSLSAGDGDGPPIDLLLGKAGVLELARVEWGERRRTTQLDWWARPSRTWASATPVALDRNPGDLHDKDATRRAEAFANAEQTIRTAVERVIVPSGDDGAAKLTHVDVLRSCVLPGTAKPVHYPRFPTSNDRPQRVLVHVRLTFDRMVRGPLLVGAGRYQGLGLFLPVDPKFEPAS